MSETTPFPSDFLWGSSISAYQAEGAILEDGKTLSAADLSTRKPGFCDNARASDFYHRYREDIALLAQMGAKAFRFSLSWPRIMPEGDGRVNAPGIAFYHALLDELERYGIEPIVTLYHYDLPMPVYERFGGWADRRTVDAFCDYARVCFQEFGGRIRYFLTINEPDIMLMYGGHGLDLTGEADFKRDRLIINHHFALAHAHAVSLCRELAPGALIAPVFGYVPAYAASCRPMDWIAARNLSDIQNRFFQELFLNGRYDRFGLDFFEWESLAPRIEDGDMELIAYAKSDFIALNYYKSDVAFWPDAEGLAAHRECCTVEDGMFATCPNPYTERTAWGWDVDGTGIRCMLREVYQAYRLPIMITENGMAHLERSEGSMVEDDYRIAYHEAHIAECGRAIAEGVDLRAYLTWSFLDLQSTSHGFGKRYGLVYIDHAEDGGGTWDRIPKKSFYWYRDLIAHNGAVPAA